MLCTRRLGYVAAAVMIGGMLPASASALCGACGHKSKCSTCGTSSVSMASPCGERPCAARVESTGEVISGAPISDSSSPCCKTTSSACCKEKPKCGLCSWLWHGGKCHTCEQTAAVETTTEISGAPIGTSEAPVLQNKPRCGACGAGNTSSESWQSSESSGKSQSKSLDKMEGESTSDNMSEEAGSSKENKPENTNENANENKSNENNVDEK
jgi:hypothetical protein